MSDKSMVSSILRIMLLFTLHQELLHDPMATVSTIQDTIPYLTSPLSEVLLKQLGYQFNEIISNCTFAGVPCGEEKLLISNFGPFSYLIRYIFYSAFDKLTTQLTAIVTPSIMDYIQE